MKRYEIAILMATGYLLIYLILFQIEAPLWALFLTFSLSPLPIIYMAVQILMDKFTVLELKDNEEYGYQDVDKNTLGLF